MFRLFAILALLVAVAFAPASIEARCRCQRPAAPEPVRTVIRAAVDRHPVRSVAVVVAQTHPVRAAAVRVVTAPVRVIRAVRNR